MEADCDRTRFSVCRFANVAKSNGSVIPFWLDSKEKGIPLKITSPNMNRMMFSKREAALLVNKAIELAEEGRSGIVLSKLMKTVNIMDLARIISDKVEITGIREGEKIHEVLVSENESKLTYTFNDDYYVILPELKLYKNWKGKKIQYWKRRRLLEISK